MMENVPGILNMVTPEGVPIVDAFTKIISDGGFGEYDALKKMLLKTAGCGVAMKRGSKKGIERESTRTESDRLQGELF